MQFVITNTFVVRASFMDVVIKCSSMLDLLLLSQELIFTKVIKSFSLNNFSIIDMDSYIGTLEEFKQARK